MRWLPAFDFHGGEARFPLCAGTALLLLRAIHAESSSEFAHQLAGGMLVDPFACLWLMHGVQADCEIQSVNQLASLVRPLHLRSRLACAVSDGLDGTNQRAVGRARRCALGAAIAIARSESSVRRAQDSPRVLAILRQAAARHGQGTSGAAVPSFASDTLSDRAGDAEALAYLEESTPLGRTLARRLHRAWSDPPSDPQQILGAAVQNLQRLSALETRFDQVLAKSKLAALKELAYGASHEINNPIANISARAQVLLRDETSPQRRRALTVIHQQSLRAYQMIADLMLFAKPPPLKCERIRVAELVAELVRDAKGDAAARGWALTIRSRVSPSLGWIDGDRLQLSLALKAICQNAIEAMGRGGTLAVLAAGGRGELGVPELRLRVRDSGPGIPPDVLPHVFDPFFSGREAGRGLGFGLSKAWRVISDHGGRIVATSHRARGSTFTVCLPRYQPRGNGCEAA